MCSTWVLGASYVGYVGFGDSLLWLCLFSVIITWVMWFWGLVTWVTWVSGNRLLTFSRLWYLFGQANCVRTVSMLHHCLFGNRISGPDSNRDLGENSDEWSDVASDGGWLSFGEPSLESEPSSLLEGEPA